MNPPERPDSLSTTLQSWRVQPPRDPGFRAAVWERVAQRSRETWSGYVRTHRLAWTMAAFAVVTVAGWTGRTAARAKIDADREAMVVTYLAELDPRVQARVRP